MADTNIATQIARIQTDRNTIRTKLVDLGLATSTDNLDTLASAVSSIANKGAVNATVKEGETYNIPAGYHNGSGVVSGVSGGGNYTLQTKSVTPTKEQQSVTADSGYYGLTSVTVAAIPENYQDVSATTAVAADVLTGKIFTDVDGVVTTGTMANNGTVTKTLDTTTKSVTIAKGYHSGSGSVSITTEEKSATPTKSTQTITPTSGKVLSKVTVAAIPDAYQNVTNVTATADKVLDTYVFVDSEGAEIEGTMVNNGAVTKTLDTTTTSYTVPTGYHNGSGVVSIVTEEKSATPTEAAQTITPASGKVLSKVTVAAIPTKYGDASETTVTSATLLADVTAIGVNANGAAVTVTGSMANNGSVTNTIDGMTSTSVSVPAGYTTGGTISLTTDIETALAAI